MKSIESRVMSQECTVSTTSLLSLNTRQSRDNRVLSHDSYLMPLRLKGVL